MTEEIDLTGLGGGTYLVVVTTNQGSTMKKLVVD
ncbi:MAG: T9SS type A sorting domain-containing protein [Bacteroidales bacterium]|nr:T9SS type A sorting domain-containing protein [Bacteroidales bacterium]